MSLEYLDSLVVRRVLYRRLLSNIFSVKIFLGIIIIVLITKPLVLIYSTIVIDS